MEKEFAHYVVTAHPPGGVLVSTKCNFLAPDSLDVLVAKSRRLEIRQLRVMESQASTAAVSGVPSTTPSFPSGSTSPFPIIAQVPINGRIVCLQPLHLVSMPTACVFVATDRLDYAVLYCNQSLDDSTTVSRSSSSSIIRTLSSGTLRDATDGASRLARLAESGPLFAVDVASRCIAIHVYEGLLTVIPVNSDYRVEQSPEEAARPHRTGHWKDSGGRGNPPVPPIAKRQPPLLGPAQHVRLEERVVLDLQFLHTATTLAPPQLVVLHQDARGAQHIITHVLQLPSNTSASRQSSLQPAWNTSSASVTIQNGAGSLKKSNVDGGSSLLIAVPPRNSAATAATASATSQDATMSNSKASASSSAVSGGIIILGQRQFTYCNGTITKIIPVPQALFLAYEALPPDPLTLSPRYLIGDEFGNLHLLTLLMQTSLSTNASSATTTPGSSDRVVALNFETLGSCTLASSLTYLRDGLVLVGSNLGDSQLVQIHDEPIAVPSQYGYAVNAANTATAMATDEQTDSALMDTTYLSVVEEYTNLGPILDFDLVPSTPGTTASEALQCQVVTASGSSKSGSLRLIRNGIGMNEYASVEIPGIQQMWSLRESIEVTSDKYLVQSFVTETRVLGVAPVSNDKMEEEEGDSEAEVAASLEEMVIPGLISESSSLFIGNAHSSDRVIQITESEIRLFSLSTGHVLSSYPGLYTVATANEAGQIAVSSPGGKLAYYIIDAAGNITMVSEKQMDREISCLDIHPFAPGDASSGAMELEDLGEDGKRPRNISHLVAVGLWDDFTVRLLSLDSNLNETICINLGNEDNEDQSMESNMISQRRHINNMMARSVCLVTLDFNSSSPGAAAHSHVRGVDMLLVGLGDGTLISFAVVTRDNAVSVQAKKEVCLGSQRISLVPLSMEGRGTCVLATGDRPTVIYLAGVGGTSSTHFNPKLCYSTVNLAATDGDDDDDVSRPPSQQVVAVNVASPFSSPLLFDSASLGPQHYSLCVADENDLKLGVIDDIQKLHVTTCRIGMAPRRIAHCADGRLFAVGCTESGIHLGLDEQEQNMLNCIRFMDDTTFEDIERIDLEPFEIIMSMSYVTLKVPRMGDNSEAVGVDGEPALTQFKPFLLVGTAYALPDEDEPTRGRILVYSFQDDDALATANVGRSVHQITELSTTGAVYSITQFYDGKILCTVNSKTHVAQLIDDSGLRKLTLAGTGHHGHILSIIARSLAKRTTSDALSQDVKSGSKQRAMEIDHEDDKRKAKQPEEMLAIVGDLMRSISVLQYYPEHDVLEEIAKDFNANWVTAIEMLNDRVFLGAENWNNLFCLRRNAHAQSEEIRCRLDNIGEFHLGEMVNKFMLGSLVMPLVSSSSTEKQLTGSPLEERTVSPSKKQGTPKKREVGTPATRSTRRPVVKTGTQTLFGTVDGTLGVVLGLDGRTAAFFGTLERAMAEVIRPVGDFSHARFRACEAENRMHPAHGFIDGDLVESFLDLDRITMQAVADEMNRDGGWEVDDPAVFQASEMKDDDMQGAAETERPELTVDDILAMVEEIAMLH